MGTQQHENTAPKERDFLRLPLGVLGYLETLGGRKRVEIVDLSQGGAHILLLDTMSGPRATYRRFQSGCNSTPSERSRGKTDRAWVSPSRTLCAPALSRKPRSRLLSWCAAISTSCATRLSSGPRASIPAPECCQSGSSPFSPSASPARYSDPAMSTGRSSFDKAAIASVNGAVLPASRNSGPW